MRKRIQAWLANGGWNVVIFDTVVGALILWAVVDACTTPDPNCYSEFVDGVGLIEVCDPPEYDPPAH